MGVYKVGVPFNQLCWCEQEACSDVPEYQDICEMLDTRTDAHIGCSSWYFTKHSMNMNSSIVLLNLLRNALGNSTEWKVEGSVDWLEVIIRAICSKY